jgi:fucokinase
LIAAVVAAVGAIVGRPFHLDLEGLNRLVHGTLYVEQILSTGGGWQDQIGGVYPGLKISRSRASLPLVVQTEILPAAPWILNELSSRLVLIFTGQQRLAKNLLRDVITGFWHGKGPGQEPSGEDAANYPANVQMALAELVSRAERCAACLSEGYWKGFAAAVDRYWTLKKYLANPAVAEPEPVRRLIARLKEPDLGFSAASFTGAGGGGFLYAFGEPDWNMEKVEEAVAAILPGGKVYRASVDLDGLNVGIVPSI